MANEKENVDEKTLRMKENRKIERSAYEDIWKAVNNLVLCYFRNMANLSRVPVVDVTKDNFREIWPSLILAMSSSSYLAMDLELSGLGHRKKLNAKSVEERYKNIAETAKSRSILSLGLSCFKQISSSTANQGDSSTNTGSSYIVQTFNILLLCDEDYVVEPPSLRFLVEHGFDFNKQYEKGISYYRGNDKVDDNSIQSIRRLLIELVSMKVPIVFHNGLVDLIFLYENLYASLPSSQAMFLADLVDLFPAGVIDTKYITDYEHLMQASYLEYVFRKCQKENSTMTPGCTVHFPHYPASYPHVTYRQCNLRPSFNISSNPELFKEVVCMTYSGHGWCSYGQHCTKSHDIDLIIDMDMYVEGRKNRKRKRRQQNKDGGIQNGEDKNLSMDENKESCEMTESITIDVVKDTNVNGDISTQDLTKTLIDGPKIETHANGSHRAGYDAFMTGFIYAVYVQKAQLNGDQTLIEERKNKLYLCGKDYPLTITKSRFMKQSKTHLAKIQEIRKLRGEETIHTD